IILGKLLGRVAQVAFLVLTGLPLLCFLGVFGGLEPLALAGFLLVTLVPLFALGAASLLASVWCRQTRDAGLALYAVGLAGWILIAVVGGYLDYLNPLFVLQPAWGHNDLTDVLEMGRRLLGFSLAWGVLGGVCLGLAVWRLRPAYVRQLEGEGRRKKGRWWR